jgi:hypothetical protein
MSSTSSWRGGAVVLALGLSTVVASAQGNWDARRNLYTRLEPGMTISVRLNDPIDAGRTDYRVYTGTVDQDVRGDNNRVAIPRGSSAELIVRTQPDGDLVLDLESVVVNGQRYAVQADPQQLEGRDRSLVGSIIGSIPGVDVRGRAVRVPRGAVMGFRLGRPLNMGVADRGVMRDGAHYHDYYGRGGRQ